MLENIRIAICDDNARFRQDLSHVFMSYGGEFRVNIGTYKFKSGVELIDELKRRQREKVDTFDIIFLDYDMGYMNGMETAEHIRKYKFNCDIVFLTKHDDFMRDAFRVKTSRFLMKPLDKYEIYDTLNCYIKEYKSKAPIVMKVEGQIVRILSSDIVYLQGDDPNTIFHLIDGSTVRNSKLLSKNFNLLPQPYFYRVHRSFVINMSYIKSIDSNIITTANNKTVPISKVKVHEFKDVYFKFSRYF